MRKFVNFFWGLSCVAFILSPLCPCSGDNTKGLSYTILGPSIAVAQDTSYSFFIHEHTKIIQMKIIKIQIERKTKHFLPLLFEQGLWWGCAFPRCAVAPQPSTGSRNKNKYIILHAAKTRARRYTDLIQIQLKKWQNNVPAAGRAPCGRRVLATLGRQPDGVVSPRGGARVDHKKAAGKRRRRHGPPICCTRPPTHSSHPRLTHGLRITQLARSICDANDCRLKPIRVLPEQIH